MGFGPFSGGDTATQSTTNEQIGQQGTGLQGQSGSGNQFAGGQDAATQSGTGSVQAASGGVALDAYGANVGNITITSSDVHAIDAIAASNEYDVGANTSLALGALQTQQTTTADALGSNTYLATQALSSMHDTAANAIDAVTHNADTNAAVDVASINANQQTTTQALSGYESLQQQLSNFESQILSAGAPQTQAFAQEALNAGVTPLSTQTATQQKYQSATLVIAIIGLGISAYFYFVKH